MNRNTVTVQLEAAKEEISKLAAAMDAARAELVNAQQINVQLEAQALQMNENLAARNTHIESLQRELAAISEENTRLKSEFSKTETKAAAKAGEIVAALGVPPVEGLAATTADSRSIREQYAAIKNPSEKTAFWRQHKAEILGSK